MNMTVIKVINAVLIILLLLLLRKLIWCLRCLWCYYHGKEMPAPITFIPQQSGRVFDRHVADATQEEAKEDE